MWDTECVSEICTPFLQTDFIRICQNNPTLFRSQYDALLISNLKLKFFIMRKYLNRFSFFKWTLLMLFIKANSRHSDTPEAFKRIVSHDGVDGHKKLQYYKWLINVCLCVMHRKQRVICLIRWWRLDGWWTTQPRGHHNKHVQEIWKTENNIFSCFISDCNKIRVCCRWYRN